MGVAEIQRGCRTASLTACVVPVAAWTILTVLTACQPDKIAAADPDAVAAWEAAMRDAGREQPGPQPSEPVSTSPNEAGADEQTPPVASVDPTTAIGEQSGGAAAPATPPTDPCAGDAGPCTSDSDAGPPPVVCVPTGPRDCTSALDNDCDGQLDNVVDDVCQCVPGTIEVCDEHPGFDGLGSCVAGSRTCVAGEGNATSAFGECNGAVAPAADDVCARGDDSNCNGVPNEGCTCVEGDTQPCGSTTDTGVCQIGSTTCINGAFGACEGAVAPAARDTCARGDDSNCNGIPNEGCTCVDGDTQPCGQDVGSCQAGTQTCTNGAFGQCVGAIGPAQRDCTSANDNDCDGRPDNTIDNVCRCTVGMMQVCGTHPQDGVGSCQAGSQQCVAGPGNASSNFGQCNGSVGPGPRNCGSPADNDCDGDADNTIDGVCECAPGQGNGPCSDDPSNSRCNGQGQCVPCQADADCSLVSGGRNVCDGGECVSAGLPDGEGCVAASDCTSGVCDQWFTDADGDGYGVGSAQRLCGTPEGFARTPGDCCDLGGASRTVAADVNPGQTGFFSAPQTVCASVADFDYDCSGAIADQIGTSVGVAQAGNCGANCDGSGWVADIGCGESGTLVECSLFMGFCSIVSTSPTARTEVRSCH